VTDIRLSVKTGRLNGFGETARAIVIVAGLLTLLAITGLVSVMHGAVDIGPGEIWAALVNPAAASPRDAVIIWSVRLPRTSMALLVGASLALSGAIMQGLFRNALADPGLTGVSSGAALAAVTIIVLGQNHFGHAALNLLPIGAFLGGLAVTALLYAISTRSGRTSVALMLLSGIALGAITMAATGLLIFISSEQQLRELTFWSMGSLAGATWAKVASVATCLLIAAPALPGLAAKLDRLSLGEREARYMGVNVERTKVIAIIVTALLTGAAVSVGGIIGFVGLVIPHMLRLAFGPSHRLLIPLALLLGGSLMILADLFARTVVAPAELPIGIVTACIGGPVFLLMLLRRARRDFA